MSEASKKQSAMKTLVKNKKISFNYEITDKYNAGIELLGFEVKSIKEGRGNMEGSYIVIRGGEAFLIGLDLPPYQQKNTPENYDSKRNRRLLLNKKELDILAKREGEKGLTIVPISLYNNGRRIKLELGVAKGKKKIDKRQTIQKRESDIEIHRTLKGGR
ncbi:MAG: SsrA-binding protein SmpB [bacterium]